MRAIIFIILLSFSTVSFAGYLDDGYSDTIPIFKTEKGPINKEEAPYQIKYIVPRFTKAHKIEALGRSGVVCLIRIDEGDFKGGTGYVPGKWYRENNAK